MKKILLAIAILFSGVNISSVQAEPQQYQPVDGELKRLLQPFVRKHEQSSRIPIVLAVAIDRDNRVIQIVTMYGTMDKNDTKNILNVIKEHTGIDVSKYKLNLMEYFG
ncbi:hypothetical protein [Gottfriedia acidiceleris]|uniref:hypothetical protein n=1 Tax=Gottfriedia acidiceleris TaxID=371036 RepID=UPI003D1D85DA